MAKNLVKHPILKDENRTVLTSLFEVVVHNRHYLVNRITELRKTSAGRYDGIANGKPFSIIGGRKAGGAKNEWFVEWTGVFTTINTKSFAESIRLIENC